MTELLEYPRIFVIIGLIISAVLFHINYRRKDGLGRIALLSFLGGTMLYYFYRFIIQILLYVTETLEPRDANAWVKHAQVFLIAPLIIIGIIELAIYRENQKKRKR